MWTYVEMSILLLFITVQAVNAYIMNYMFEVCQDPTASTQKTLNMGYAGIVTSPNYPDAYFANSDCNLQITAPEDYFIKVQIVDWEVEYGFDYLEMYESSLLARVENGTVDDIISSSNTIRFRWITDVDVEHRGFKASVTLHVAGDRYRGICAPQGSVSLTPGTAIEVTSPNYPIRYYEGSNCHLVIEAPLRYFIKVEIVDLQIEEYSDKLVVHDSDRYRYVIDDLGNVTSRLDNITLSWYTDEGMEMPGFKVKVTAEEECPLPYVSDGSASRLMLPMGDQLITHCGFFYELLEAPTDPFCQNATWWPPLPPLKCKRIVRVLQAEDTCSSSFTAGEPVFELTDGAFSSCTSRTEPDTAAAGSVRIAVNNNHMIGRVRYVVITGRSLTCSPEDAITVFQLTSCGYWSNCEPSGMCHLRYDQHQQQILGDLSTCTFKCDKADDVYGFFVYVAKRASLVGEVRSLCEIELA